MHILRNSLPLLYPDILRYPLSRILYEEGAKVKPADMCSIHGGKFLAYIISRVFPEEVWRRKFDSSQDPYPLRFLLELELFVTRTP